MIETIIIPIIVALITSLATFLVQKDRLKTELKTEFMAEAAIKSLLEDERWQKRSFSAIEKRIRGFEEKELKKLLVRAGAVCFEGNNGEELWGLISKNSDSLD